MTDLEKIATDCRAAASYYTEKPGLAQPHLIADVYAQLANISAAVERRLKSLDNAVEPPQR